MIHMYINQYINLEIASPPKTWRAKSQAAAHFSEP